MTANQVSYIQEVYPSTCLPASSSLQRKEKTTSNISTIYWRCENRACKARLQTDENYKELKKIGIHNHASTAAKVNARIAVPNIKAQLI